MDCAVTIAFTIALKNVIKNRLNKSVGIEALSFNFNVFWFEKIELFIDKNGFRSRFGVL